MSKTGQTLIEIKQLSRHYGSFTAVNNINFELKRGEILGFLGPNGAGKSTTMNMLCGVLAPSEGSIYINSIDLFTSAAEAKRFIGYLPEQPPLYINLTVDEYLRFCGQLHRIKKQALTKTIESTKARCGLEDCGKRLIANLSKGYQQRVGIAQAILHSPLLVVLDEPTVGLDPNQILEMRKLIKEIGQEHGVILSTHILPEVQTVCSHVQIIKQGKLIFSDSINNLDEQLKTDSLIIKLRQIPDKSALLNIQGIEEIDFLTHDRIRLHYNPEHNPNDQLLSTCLKHNWGLLELTPEIRSLEQVFVELTNQEI